MSASPAPIVTLGAAARPARRTLGHLVQETARLMRRRFTQYAQSQHLPLTQLEATVLRRLAREEGIHQAHLAQMLDIEPIALTRLLDHLQEMGLIERRQHPSDRRSRTLWLTPAAAPILATIRRVDRAVRHEALAGIDDDACERLIDQLIEVRGNLMRSITLDPGHPDRGLPHEVT